MASAPLVAQNPDNINVNTTAFEYKYRMMPTHPQDPLLFNYLVALESNPGSRAVYDDNSLLKRLVVDGQTKVSVDTNNEYVLILRLGDLEILSSSVPSSGSGFTVMVKYKFPVRVEMLDNKEAKDMLQPDVDRLVRFPQNPEKTFHTKTFANTKEANDYWANNRDVIKNQIIRSEIDWAVSEARRIASTRYGFYIADGKEELKTMDTKKHFENLLVQENVAELKKKLASLDATTPLTEQAVAPQIEYFKALAEKYNGPTKADLRLRYIAYYNLCQTYMLLDRPDLVMPWADKLIANDAWPKHGEKFKKDADKLMALLIEAPYKNRQFVPQP
jgi:hypothetical protein